MGGKPALMEPLETHVYVWLLCLDWNQGGFVEDEKALARWCRVAPSTFRKAWPVVRECFELRGDRLFNPRLEKERGRQAEWREKSSRGGKKSAETRKGGARVVEPPHQPTAQPKGNTPVSYSPVPDITPTATTSAVAKAPRAKRARESWLLPSCAVWERHKGAGSFQWGKAGAALKPLHDAGHSADEIANRLDRYVPMAGKYLSLAHFASTFNDHAAAKLTGPVVVDGWFSPEVDRLTAPSPSGRVA